MNVYDFDNTIYSGDSTEDFIRWCVKKKPSLALRLAHGGAAFCAYKINLCSKTHFKERMYGFLQGISDIDAWVEEFWDGHICNIKQWYLDEQREDDVIISASPEFLLLPAMRRLNISHLMASRVDKRTGFYYGVNCHGEEKVRRFKEKFNIEDIEKFYSDSLTDAPLARLAKESFLVLGDTVIPYEY